MIKVKLTTSIPKWPLARQTPREAGIWNNCRFFVDDDTLECDCWVVFESLEQELTVNCYPDNTILITAEPPAIKKYDKNFIAQFATVITVQKNIKAQNVINLSLLPWYVGAHFNTEDNRFDKYTKSYDELKQISDIPKTKLISVISSNKSSTKGHRQRLKFIKILKEHFGERLDVFGSGVNIIGDKWDGIAPYKYHIAIENSSEKNYWTEKLADSILAGAYTFYYGSPNIDDYFAAQALSKIDIYNPAEAIEIMEKAIREDYYEKFKGQIKEAKNLILDEYQIFPQLSEIIEELQNNNAGHIKKSITIKPEKKKKNIILRALKRLKRIIMTRRPAELGLGEFAIIQQLPGFLDIENYKLFQFLSEISGKKTEPILEIGVFCGRSLLALAYAYPKNKVTGVDPFYEDFLNSPAGTEEAQYLKKKSGSQKKNQRIDNFKRVSSINNAGDKIELKLMSQDEFLSGEIMNKFQLVHIDGEHTYKAVKDFFDMAGKVLIENALVVVDDFLNAGFPGISEAVHRHPGYKKDFYPLLYAFNKALFIYKPASQKNINELLAQISHHYDNKNEYIKVEDLNDKSLMVQKK